MTPKRCRGFDQEIASAWIDQYDGECAKYCLCV